MQQRMLMMPSVSLDVFSLLLIIVWLICGCTEGKLKGFWAKQFRRSRQLLMKVRRTYLLFVIFFVLLSLIDAVF